MPYADPNDQKRCLRDRIERFRGMGLCERCGQVPPIPGRRACEQCLASQRERAAQRYREKHPECGTVTIGRPRGSKNGTGSQSVTYYTRKNKGLCTKCGKSPAAVGLLCAPCREKDNTEARAFRATNPDHWLWRKYGITKAEWLDLFESQGQRCAICGRGAPTGRGWATDHCHATGVVRGILCHQCNAGLGHFGDSPEIMLRARQYLVRSKARPVKRDAPPPQLTLVGGRLA